MRYAVRELQAGTRSDKVALVLSLSGQIQRESLPDEIDAGFSVYELTLAEAQPSVDFLRTRQDLDEFRVTYRALLSRIAGDHPDAKELHVFPAVPAPVAVVCGHDLLPKVHPTLLVYDHDKRHGGFVLGLSVN